MKPTIKLAFVFGLIVVAIVGIVINYKMKRSSDNEEKLMEMTSGHLSIPYNMVSI